MKKKQFKKNQEVFVLYVNITNFYNSFKIEQVKFLGEVKNNAVSYHKMYMVEDRNDGVNYVNFEDIFETEKDAELHLAGIIMKKYV